jgi:hypothetical protein
MADNKKSGIGVVAIVSILFVGLATFFVVKGFGQKPKKQNKEGGEDEGGTTPKKKSSVSVGDLETTQIGDISTSTDWKFPIRRSQKNDSVKNLQLLLLKINPKIIKDGATGFFGSQTEAALFQVLGKKSVTSQADIDAIVTKGSVAKLGANLILNAQLGIPTNTQIIK